MNTLLLRDARLVQDGCDFLVKLPQMGEVSSLNVAQASTACMYEWLRQNWGLRA